MSDKTTEEAAEENYPTIRRDTQSGGIYSPQVVRDYNRLQISKQEAFVAGYESAQSTIAQLREKNERYQWVSVEIPPKSKGEIVVTDWVHKGLACYDNGSWFMDNIFFEPTHYFELPIPPTETLTPKPPKTNG